MTRKILFLSSFASLLFLISFSLAGCPVEKAAYKGAVGAKVFLDSVKADHPECSQPNTTGTLCETLHRATAAKDVLIDAGETYCGNEDYFKGGKACSPPDKKTAAYKQAYDKLEAALQTYQQTEKDLRALISKGAH